MTPRQDNVGCSFFDTDLYRLSGGGNDFLALAEPAFSLAEERIRAWCTRGSSLGADGLFVLTREAGGVRMDYYNADGRAADLCLNGTRCAARLAFHLGWAIDRVEIQTGAGRVEARRRSATEVEVELPPIARPPREVSVEIDGTVWEGFFITVGVPHFVIRWRSEIASAPLAAIAPRLRRHEAFGPAGANIDFVRFQARRSFELRTFERGVEGETLACGTGVSAAAVFGLLVGEIELPVQALTRGGFVLTVSGEVSAHRLPARWFLGGDARLLAHERVSAEALALPEPPAW